MCFSAEASFIGGTVLTAIGTMTVRKNHEPAQRLLATMPFIFGLQQLSEGFVWIGLKSTDRELLLKIAAYVFLTAALIVWPIFVPLAMRLLESNPLRRRLLNGLVGLGLLTSLAYLGGMLFFKMNVQRIGSHVMYSAQAPSIALKIAYFSYLAVTIMPFILSVNHRIWILGAVIIVSYAIATYFYSEHLLSVWCFFAAGCSCLVWWIVGARVMQTDLDTVKSS